MVHPIEIKHPSPQQLAAFAKGTLSNGDDQSVEAHVAVCDECTQTLSALSDDTIVGLLRDKDQAEVPTWQQATLPPAGERTAGADGSQVRSAAPPAELVEHAKFQILELLGEGGMGSVYKAQHRVMNRPVALKVINRELVRNDAAAKRFQREVQAAARLSHPNIVTAYDADHAGDVHFLMMEYVDGIDLAEIVRTRGPLPLHQACDYIRQAALGLEHAHEHGMVHRDIKPQNLMLTPKGQVKILDFGLASFATESAAEQVQSAQSLPGPPESAPAGAAHLTQLGAMMGTPDYIAPEQARDAHQADIRADIYSLGCTLYFLLAGQPPFAGASVLEKVMAHVQRPPKPLAELRDDLPPGLEEVLRRMLAKDPSQRYQSPAELAEALAPFVIPSAKANTRKPGMGTAMTIAATVAIVLFVVLAGVLVVVTDRGRLEIVSEAGDVEIEVTSNGQEVATIDAKTGSQVRWLPSGDYQVKLKGADNDIQLDKAGFQMSRLGKAIVVAKWNAQVMGAIRSFTPADKPITQNDVTAEEGGWKIVATDPRTVRLYEVRDPGLAKGPFFYRAKLKTQDIKGKAYLEMWVRLPGQGEYFSKGFHIALSGTNGWAEYEIPFLLEAGQQPDLIKLNLTIEGRGTVWVKDVELRGRPAAGITMPGRIDLPDFAATADRNRLQGKWVAVAVQVGNGQIPSDTVPQWTMTFTGDQVRVTMPMGDGEGTFTIDPAKDPKEIDVNPSDGQGRMRGIYRFVGEELEVCMDDANRKRPIQWQAEAGTRQLLVRLSRSIAESKP